MMNNESNVINKDENNNAGKFTTGAKITDTPNVYQGWYTDVTIYPHNPYDLFNQDFQLIPPGTKYPDRLFLERFSKCGMFDMHPFNVNVRVPILSHHTIIGQTDHYFCAACDEVLNNPLNHMSKVAHVKALESYPHMETLGNNLIRAIRGNLHCALCNVIIKIIDINIHIWSAQHADALCRALGIVVVTPYIVQAIPEQNAPYATNDDHMPFVSNEEIHDVYNYTNNEVTFINGENSNINNSTLMVNADTEAAITPRVPLFRPQFNHRYDNINNLRTTYVRKSHAIEIVSPEDANKTDIEPKKITKDRNDDSNDVIDVDKGKDDSNDTIDSYKGKDDSNDAINGDKVTATEDSNAGAKITKYGNEDSGTRKDATNDSKTTKDDNIGAKTTKYNETDIKTTISGNADTGATKDDGNNYTKLKGDSILDTEIPKDGIKYIETTNDINDTKTPILDKITETRTNTKENTQNTTNFDANRSFIFKFGTTNFEISLSSYNTIILRDAAGYCFVCSKAVKFLSIFDHIESKIHSVNLADAEFIDGMQLIRQVKTKYHCAICNAIIIQRNIKSHTKSHTHKENYKKCCKIQDKRLLKGTEHATTSLNKNKSLLKETEHATTSLNKNKSLLKETEHATTRLNKNKSLLKETEHATTSLNKNKSLLKETEHATTRLNKNNSLLKETEHTTTSLNKNKSLLKETEHATTSLNKNKSILKETEHATTRLNKNKSLLKETEHATTSLNKNKSLLKETEHATTRLNKNKSLLKETEHATTSLNTNKSLLKDTKNLPKTKKEYLTEEEKENFKKILSEFSPDLKKKMIKIGNNVIKLSFESWHGIVTVKNKNRCVLCQKYLNKDLKKHVLTEMHQEGLNKIIDKAFLPALMRKIDEITYNCLTCNITIPSTESVTRDHIASQNHRKTYDTLTQNGASVTSHSDCYDSVLTF